MVAQFYYNTEFNITTRNSGENVKRRRLLFARDAFRRIAGSFRRVLLGPKRQESLQHIVDSYFSVEIKPPKLTSLPWLLFPRKRANKGLAVCWSSGVNQLNK